MSQGLWNSLFWESATEKDSQGYVIALLLYEVVTNVLIIVIKGIDLCNFAEDTAPYICDLSLTLALGKVGHKPFSMFAFYLNQNMFVKC